MQKSKASSGGPKHALLLGLGPGVAPGRVACCLDSRKRLSPFSRSIFVPRWRARACSGVLGRAGRAPSKAWVRPAPKFALPAGPGRAPASSPAWQHPARSATRQVCNPPTNYLTYSSTHYLGDGLLSCVPNEGARSGRQGDRTFTKTSLGTLVTPQNRMAAGRRVWVHFLKKLTFS